MDEMGIPERQGEQQLFQQLVGRYDAPAYIRRGRQVEEALELLLKQCRQQRDKWLKEVRGRLEYLSSLVGDWLALRPLLADDVQLTLFPQLQEMLAVKPLFRVGERPARGVKRALQQLAGSLVQLNRRWRDFLSRQNLGPLNELRDGYNRFYVLEKECALRSARLARHGFQRLEPLTTEDLLVHLPLLPVPRLV